MNLFYEEHVNIDGSLLLKEKGFDWPCRLMYAKNTRVADEIIKKHPGLSDDGYMDLMKEYGGIYERDELYRTYKEPVQAVCRNTPEFLEEGWHRMICAIPTTAQARNWLRKMHRIDIVVRPEGTIYKADIVIPDKEDTTRKARIALVVSKPVDNVTDDSTICFNSYNEAEQAAILLATKYIDNKDNPMMNTNDNRYDREND